LGRWVLNRNFWCKCSRDIETDRKQWYISRYHAGFSSTILRGPYRSLSRAIQRNDFRVADPAQNFKKSGAEFSYERDVETEGTAGLPLRENQVFSKSSAGQKPSSETVCFRGNNDISRRAAPRQIECSIIMIPKAILNFKIAKTSESTTNFKLFATATSKAYQKLSREKGLNTAWQELNTRVLARILNGGSSRGSGRRRR
jgi:hypothetical protein